MYSFWNVFMSYHAAERDKHKMIVAYEDGYLSRTNSMNTGALKIILPIIIHKRAGHTWIFPSALLMMLQMILNLFCLP